MDIFSIEQINSGTQIIMHWLQIYTPKVVGAILTLVIGWWCIKQINKVTAKGFEKTRIDITVSKFFANMLSVSLKILLLITVAGMFGIQTTSFIALL